MIGARPGEGPPAAVRPLGTRRPTAQARFSPPKISDTDESSKTASMASELN
jgi:hypothetical protein